MTIEEILAAAENQTFERKSIFIKPEDLSATLCALANADGGTVAIGITDKSRRIEGVDRHQDLVNDILRVLVDCCTPTVPVTSQLVICVNTQGQHDHVLLLQVEPSPRLHVNQADEAFVRVGDKTKKLGFNDRLSLMYAKGLRFFEDETVADASLDDLDFELLPKDRLWQNSS
ncbi:MAG: ATP-binding protein [Succinivibrio sp.]|nr:ATP-binding protein [Succinivibrio sp.]